jgi:hypothetical protein
MEASQRFGAEDRWINRLCGLNLIERTNFFAIHSLVSCTVRISADLKKADVGVRLS